MRRNPRGLSAADTTILVSITSRSGSISWFHKAGIGPLFLLGLPRAPDDPVNLAGRDCVGTFASRFFAKNPEHFRLGCGQLHIVPDAQQNGFGCATFLDNQRLAFVLDALKKFAEAGAGTEHGDNDGFIRAGCERIELSSSIIGSVQLKAQVYIAGTALSSPVWSCERNVRRGE